MSPINPFIAAQLRQLIYYHLDNDLLQNALFCAGRLHGLEPRNPDAAHLFALCNLRLGRLKAAYEYSRDKGLRGHHLGCAYVFAQACLGLERYADGIGALDRTRGLWDGRSHWNKHSENSRRHLPDAAAVNCLLGKLWLGMGDVNQAVKCYVEALRGNPFMWDAFQDLCDKIGVPMNTSNVFRVTPEMLAYLSVFAGANGTSAESPPHNAPLQPQMNNSSNRTIATPGNDPFNPPLRATGDSGLNFEGSGLFSRLNGGISSTNGGTLQYSEWDTPTASGGTHDEDVMMGQPNVSAANHLSGSEPPQAPMRRTRMVNPFASDPALEAPKMRLISTRSKMKTSSESSEPVEASRVVSMTSNHKRTISGHATQSSTSVGADPNAAPQRRSERLLNTIRPSRSRLVSGTSKEPETKEKRELRKAKATGTKGRSTSTVGRVVSGNRTLKEVPDRDTKEARPPSVTSTASTMTQKLAAATVNDTSREQEALQWLLDLFAKLGQGYYLLSRYLCQAALQTFALVPTAQRETPWVLAQIGRAHYERSAYVEAEQVFTKIKKIAPSRMEDMEVYSTVLWHLKNELDLAYLSHELIEADRLSPQAWCAVGNSFSLQREHDQAIKCFKRATQLDPKFAYAFTLQGHEHIANEEYDKALYAYRSAISADSRHYNGWYGLGRTFERMGKYEIAEKHYKCAASINPTNAVLVVCIGVVLEKLRRTEAALVQYTHACELDPRSALSRFKKARVLMNLRQPKEALRELEILKDIAPDEANVHFMLGRLYKMMRDRTGAIRHYTIALNLDPKAAQYIKEAMESLDDDDDDDEFDDSNVA